MIKMSLTLFSLLFTIFASFSSNTKALDSIITRSSFPQGFIFGAASSSYQIEGAANVNGKGQSDWDYQLHKIPSVSADGSNGDVADDFYHRYKEDIKLMKDMGLDSFRFSISWSRILPNGNKGGGVNQLGIDFYNNLINELLANGILPLVTLFHWDIPQALEEKYGGFLSPDVVRDFEEYVDIYFKEFGDRVKHWITLNEPNAYARVGYGDGVLVPNRCSSLLNVSLPFGSFPCTQGNSATEPYMVAHHLLLSHASAFHLYKHKYQGIQKGKIGITVLCDWAEPYDEQPSSKDAAERLYQHLCGWIYNPVTFGEYPESMRSLVGERLPKFTMTQSKMLKKSFDFLGLNSYSGSYVYDQQPTVQHYELDAYAASTYWNKNNQSIGKPSPIPWLFDYPEGLEKLVVRLKERYGNPVIFINENGYGTLDQLNSSRSLDEYLKDSPRIEYLQGHLAHLLKAIERGANVKGYFVWSFMDAFEWNSGYLAKFGLNYIDRENNLTRVTKDSGKWYKNFLRSEIAEKLNTF